MSNVEAEIKRYLEEDISERDEDPLYYWKVKEKIYHSLATGHIWPFLVQALYPK